MKNPGTPYRLEMRADSLSSNEEGSTSSQLLKPHFILKKFFSTDNQRPFTFVINSSYFECHVVLVVLN